MKNNKKDVVIIDCGANIGASILYYKDEYKKRVKQVYGFECDPVNVDVLNCLFDKEENVKIYGKGVWVENKKQTMYLERCQFDKDVKKVERNPARSASSIVPGKTNSGGFGELWEPVNKIEVELIDLASWILENIRKEDYNVLKVDVEGAEYWLIPQLLKNQKIVDTIDRWDIEITDHKRFTGSMITYEDWDSLINLCIQKLGNKFTNWTKDIGSYTKKIRNTLIEEKSGKKFNEFCKLSEQKIAPLMSQSVSDINSLPLSEIKNHVNSLGYIEDESKLIISDFFENLFKPGGVRREFINFEEFMYSFETALNFAFGRKDLEAKIFFNNILFRTRFESFDKFDLEHKGLKIKQQVGAE